MHQITKDQCMKNKSLIFYSLLLNITLIRHEVLILSLKF